MKVGNRESFLTPDASAASIHLLATTKLIIAIYTYKLIVNF